MTQEVRLLRETLTYFKGARQYVFEPDGGNVSVYGDNATGKTTLQDAWNWLRTGKDSEGKADFDIKTLDENNKALPNLDHQVEALILVDGRQTTLARLYKEKWTQKRGSANSEFSGHTTSYFVDGVPVSEADFKIRLAKLWDEATMTLLTDPTYFNDDKRLPWKQRREVLLQVCGNVTDADVIAGNPNLRELPGILAGRKLADHKEVVKAGLKKINDELKTLPVRVDEATRALPEASGNPDEIRREIASLNEQRQERAAELTSGNADAALAEAKRQLSGITIKIMDADTAAREANSKAVQAEQSKLNTASDKANELQRNIRTLQGAIQESEADVQRYTAKLSSLSAAWDQEDAKEFSFEQSETCPTCGQALPHEHLQSARDKAQGAFNLAKSQKLESIEAEGAEATKRLNAAKDAIVDNAAKLERAKVALTDVQAEVVAIQGRVANLRSAVPDHTKQPEYQQLLADKQQLESEIAEMRNGGEVARQMVADAVKEFDDKINNLNGQLTKLAQRKQGLARIEELQAEEKRLTAEYERLQKEQFLCEEFTRAQARMLEEHINSRFIYAKFRLFQEQINGGLEETCECLLDGVPYSSMNSGGRIKVGLDIINTLSRHYEFTAPIWIDNAESYTGPIPTDAQVIRLVVNEDDKVLRVVSEVPAVLEGEAV